MSDLTEYFTMTDRMVELERQLRSARSLVSIYKKRCRILASKPVNSPTRMRKAVQLLLEKKYTITEVAELCFLSKSTIYNIRWRIKVDGPDCIFTGRTPKQITKFCDTDL